MKRQIVVATKNPGKIKEIENLLQGLGFSVSSLLDKDDFPEIIEDASTFEGNAIIKAQAVSNACHCAALADDSGLEVDALGGAPGVLSARYGETGWSDAQRYLYLLDNLVDVPEEKRTARFRCALAYLEPNSKPEIFNGIFEGKIGFKPVGTNGFGYDPIFIPNGYSTSVANLPALEKKKISHRAKAIKAFMDWLSKAK